MTLRLQGSSSGYTEIDAPAVAGSNTLVLPTGNGTADQALVTNGSGALSWSDRGRMVLETAKASTSGTSVDFTGIPSWVKRVTVMFSGVSTSGTSIPQIQLGTSGGVVASGYLGSVDTSVAGVTAQTFTTGLAFCRSGAATATAVRHGLATFVSFGNNTWAGTMLNGQSDSAAMNYSACSIALSGTLDRIRITTVNGTDAFDAGTVNILYEG